MKSDDTQPPLASETARTVLDEVTPAPTTPTSTATAEELSLAYQHILSQKLINGPIRYELDRQLGHGQQGIVFQAVRHGARSCQTQHAIKLLDPSIYSSPERYWTDMGRLARQVSILQRVQNDNLVHRDNYDEHNGIGFIQMSIIDGVDLRALLNGTHLAIARSQSSDEEWNTFGRTLFVIKEDAPFRFRAGLAIYILRKCLLGLEAMHNKNFLHADIKPSNIMIDQSGSIKLIDFGRAVVVNEEPSILLGTPAYMAPETHGKSMAQIASDLYSLGLVLLEMLSGGLDIHKGSMTDAKLRERKIGLPDRLDSLIPTDIPARILVLQLLEKFLQVNSRHRFQTTREILDKSYALRGLIREIALLHPEVDYARDLQLYMQKISNPDSGHIHPGLQ